ncbi:hypothetical protein ACFO26_02915 [Lactococcus nasutitermitis]|uniref:Uncharacterized protein n=1 Tax=Lactococcus nasutitermitis TaxID=1652957 RepID=A0ABV9JC34_9LACT|nr:hypothetical protein [Lactococcus nasutitermitis]
MKQEIDVIFATHGVQAGAQAQFDISAHTWTVWTEQGKTRTFKSIVGYVRFMTKGTLL